MQGAMMGTILLIPWFGCLYPSRNASKRSPTRCEAGHERQETQRLYREEGLAGDGAPRGTGPTRSKLARLLNYG